MWGHSQRTATRFNQTKLLRRISNDEVDEVTDDGRCPGRPDGRQHRDGAVPVVPKSVSSNSNLGHQASFVDKDKHACKGQNSCKGKGGCKAGDNGCKGKNSCKGKGGCATDGSKPPSA